MRKPIILAAIALFAASSGAALADHADTSLHRTSRNREILLGRLKQKIDTLGYDIRSVELDDGVFKARIVDRQSGLPVRAKFDAVSSELLRAAPGSEWAPTLRCRIVLAIASCSMAMRHIVCPTP
ncbi:PepSY domain-containing protein [Bradyrhizobium sp. Pa8]|uniref:PepSY domain-containing protein n=1 Tax=Bradyrhizobium sp. Pa8 TaxID=3386552 RepID=UPI00403F4C5B